MKETDYVVAGTGAQRTITARTDRAKRRTPVPVSFNDDVSALEFIRAANAEGYRFSGQELVDRECRLVRYGYFVKVSDNQLAHAGHDWGPPDPVFEPGDVYPGGPRNGKEAVVLDIVTGDSAKMVGVDVMVVLEERPAAEPPVAGPPHPVPEEV